MSNQSVFRWTFIVMVTFVIFAGYCGWRSGQVYGYCEGKYGPGVDVIFTGTLGITGECELSPGTPATRVVVP